MIECQRKLLGDHVRNNALVRALKAVIRPGMTVTDIGSGTGFLSFLALKCGAKRCYLYETSEDLLRLSERIARTNGLYQKCTFIHAHSRDIRSPMKTDIVMSETLGNFAYEEHIIENMNDAKHFLKPGGTLIPQKLRQYIAPVVTDRLWKEINIWDNIGHDIDFHHAKEIALNNMYVKNIQSPELLLNTNAGEQYSLPRRGRVRERGYDQPSLCKNPHFNKDGVCFDQNTHRSPPPIPLPPGGGIWDSIDFTKHNSSHRAGTATWTLPRATTIYGFALWWECDLVPGVTISTSPFAKPTHWEQVFLPLLSPLEAKNGDRLSCSVTADSSYKIGLNVAWHTTIYRGKKRIADQKQELQKGMIFP